jgi:hypothetical protein
VAKEVHKLQQLSDGDSNPHIQELKAHHNELVKAHNELVDSCNNNFKNMSNIQQQLDIRLGAAYSALQDLVDSLACAGKNGVNSYTSLMHIVPTPDGVDGPSGGRIDWTKYIQQHIDTLQVELARIQMEKQKLAGGGVELVPLEGLASSIANHAESPLITPAGAEEPDDEEPATVFGGDHA